MKGERIRIEDSGEAFCTRCSTLAIHCEKYDAYYCKPCNIWLEERCIDPLCTACSKRPIRPIKKIKPKVKKKRTYRIKW